MTNRYWKIPVFLSFLMIFAMAWGSNAYDWDHFLTGWESDLQSWLVDHTPPTWSYLFCGGLTRLGDPQAFGLSPLFALTFVLGTFVTTKLLVLGCALAGAYGIKLILDALNPSASSRDHWTWGALWSTSFYFLWHIVGGHLTFQLMHLQVLWLGLLLQVFHSRRVRAWIPFILVWSIFSAGFYHATLFFFVPALTALVLTCILSRSHRLLLRRESIIFIGASVLGLMTASYKWWGVIAHQLHSPRTLTQGIPDTNPWIQIVHSFLIPTPSGEYAFRLGPTFDRGPYEIWEYSVFSLIPLVLALTLGVQIFARIRDRARPPLRVSGLGLTFSIALITFGLALSLGISAHPSLFGWINSHILKDSMRVAGRFQIVAYLGLLLFTAQLMHSRLSQRLRETMLTLALTLQLGLALEFWPRVDFEYASRLFHLKPQINTQLSEVLFQTPDQWGNPTHMYPVLLGGVPVLNCYNPLTSDWRAKHAPKSVLQGHHYDEPFSFLIPPPGATLSSECTSKSYFTRSRVVVDPSCPSGTCLMLNALHLRDREGLGSRLNSSSELFCTSSPPDHTSRN